MFNKIEELSEVYENMRKSIDKFRSLQFMYEFFENI